MPETTRHAIVTSAASGIGRALVMELRSRGVTVTGLDLRPSDTTDHVVDLLAEDLGTLANDCPAWDMLFHAAGAAADAAPEVILTLNTLVPCLLTEALMLKAKAEASVLAVASVSAHLAAFDEATLAEAARLSPQDVPAFVRAQALDGPLAYRLSKRVLRDWARDMAASQTDIRVNTVSPGPVKTPLWERARAASPTAGDMFLTHVPRVPTPDALAPAMVALCGPEFFWLNGVDVPLDGGLQARLIQEAKQ